MILLIAILLMAILVVAVIMLVRKPTTQTQQQIGPQFNSTSDQMAASKTNQFTSFSGMLGGERLYGRSPHQPAPQPVVVVQNDNSFLDGVIAAELIGSFTQPPEVIINETVVVDQPSYDPPDSGFSGFDDGNTGGSGSGGDW